VFQNDSARALDVLRLPSDQSCEVRRVYLGCKGVRASSPAASWLKFCQPPTVYDLTFQRTQLSG
jgi:hypothetical protein